MKIGFVLDDGLDKPDGVQQYILTLGSWLTKQKHTVHYLVGQSQQRDDVTVHSLSKNLKVRFNHNRMSIPLPANKERIRRLLETENYDVLHVQMPYSPQLAGRIIKLAPDHTAVVGTFHILPYGRLEQTATKALSLILKRNNRRFDALLSVSKAAQAFAKQSYGIKTQVLPNVIDIKAFKAKKPKHKDLRIVFLGRLVERKGCEALLRAVALLPHSVKEQLTVVIGGTGPLKRKLVSLAKKLNLSEQVSFEGFIAEKDKAAFLAQADLAVFPAYGGESFGIVLLEAMAAKAQVVLAGDNPGYASVLGSVRKTLLPAANIRKMSEQIELFLRDPELRAMIHEQQQKLVKQYDVKIVGTKLVAIYTQAIAKRPPTSHNTEHEVSPKIP
jgi:phosphatidyl-myo-inositol alpha-mannosyltransferase